MNNWCGKCRVRESLPQLKVASFGVALLTQKSIEKLSPALALTTQPEHKNHHKHSTHHIRLEAEIAVGGIATPPLQSTRTKAIPRPCRLQNCRLRGKMMPMLLPHCPITMSQIQSVEVPEIEKHCCSVPDVVVFHTFYLMST